MTRELLIKVLSEWVLAHGPGTYNYNAKNARYAVADFMAITDFLFYLKGVKGESFTINKQEGEEKP